jgi:succinyl-CoA synthetase beta subunit
MNGIDIDDIDPYHPSLIKSQAIALCMVRDKVERYIAKGRPLEAQGCKQSLRIMWQCFMEFKDVDTGWGEL